MPQNKSLDGRSALVTGGGQGIGLAIAARLAEAGASVAITDIAPGVLKPAIARLREAGRPVISFDTDVTQPKAVSRMANAVAKEFGHLDILVHNASHHHNSSIADLPFEKWEAIRAVNLDAMFYTAQAVLPHMRRQRSGAIIGISSSAAVPNPRSTVAYGAVKAGLERFLLGLSYEVQKDGISVNGIRIERAVDSPTARHWFKTDGRPKGWLPPEVVAESALWIVEQGIACTTNIFQLADFRTRVPAVDAIFRAIDGK